MTSLQLFSWDLCVEGLLPEGWDQEVLDATRRTAKEVLLDGSSVTSRQSTGEAQRYYVVTGDVIRAEIPWLDALYRGPLLERAARAFDRRLHVAEDVRSAVNINRLVKGTEYESHVDSNPVTGLLFVTEHTTDGCLVFEPPGDARLRVAPVPGTFLAFDARQVPHWVEPLTASHERVSIPMNYYLSATDQYRPADLDHYIYGER
jgi:hypothetical protein